MENREIAGGPPFVHVRSRPPQRHEPIPSTADRYFSVSYASRARNAAAGVTGILVHKGGNFLQALEGPEDAVRATMERIARDRRHRAIIKLNESFRAERLFGRWSMAFEEVPELDPSAHPGLSRFLGDGQLPTAIDPEAEDIYGFFRTFRANMR